MRRIILLSLFAAILVGCSSQEEATSAQSPPPAPALADQPQSQTFEVTTVDGKFEPAEITAKPGHIKINVTNKGTKEHGIEVEGYGVEARVASIAPGSSATLEVHASTPGTYEIYCPVMGHKEKGMVGKLIVQ